MTKAPVITIDGPSASGKGTIAQLLAAKLKWHLLDSGCLYRVLGHAATLRGLSLQDESSLAVLAEHLDVQFKTTGLGMPPRVILEGTDVTEVIRHEIAGNNASKVASLAQVRKALINRQRSFREAPGLVTDGRDMGSVIFPDADVKFYLIASAQIRAQRRYKQLKDKGISVKLSDLVSELEERDKRDSERSVAPLKQPDGSICIDTDGLNIEQVFQVIWESVTQQLSGV